MSRQIGAQSKAIVSQYLVSQYPQEGYFTSIQSAINQATNDIGSNLCAAAVVVVKAGNFNESVILATNVDLISLCEQQNTQYGNARILGSVTSNSSIDNCYVKNFQIDSYVHTGSTGNAVITFENCYFEGNINQNETIFISTSSNDDIITFKNCYITSSNPVNPTLIQFASNATLVLDSAVTAITQGSGSLSFSSTTPLAGKVVARGYSSIFAAENGVTSYIDFKRNNPLPSLQVFQDMNVDLENVIFGDTILFNGCRGTVNNCQFLTQGYQTNVGSACINYNTGTSSATSIMTFTNCTFQTDVGYAITGTSASQITCDNCKLINPNSPYVPPNLFFSSFTGTLTGISYSNGVSTPARFQRDANATTNRNAALAVLSAHNLNNNGNSIGTCNSILDVNSTGSSATNFGYWSSNAIYNSSSWTCEGDGTNNGGGYISVNPLGVMQQGIFPTSGTNAVTPSNPSCTSTLREFQIEFLANYGSFTGSQEIKTQAVLQTSTNTLTTLYSIALNTNESIFFSGTVIASNAAHTDSCGGTFEAVAQRGTGNITLVGTPIINVNSTSTTFFNVSVNPATNTINLNVQGIGATTYNWVSFIKYHKVLSSN